jgi:DNA-binding NarL/FixJ family response regulator
MNTAVLTAAPAIPARPFAPGALMTDTSAVAPIRVLLCDDHNVVLAGVERLVSTFAGIEVVGTASEGATAVRLAAALTPDVVLMDMQMPGMDGVETTKALLQECPAARVVILTSFSDRHRIHAALDAGAIGYQLKDATPAELDAAIRAAARGEAPLAPKVAMALVRQSEAVAVLSARELETLALVAKGLPNKRIARQLGITEATVKAHLTSIFRSIGAENRTQAARWYERTQGDGAS